MKKLIPLAIVLLLANNPCKKEIESKPGYSKPISSNPSKPTTPTTPNPRDPKGSWGDVKK
ncbi:MAG: hypothetical protein ABI378_04955 [Chitinophagaceae bacterium]